MAFRAVRTTILVVAFVTVFAIVSGDSVEGRRSISEEEDLELEKELRIQNKPVLRTIKTEYGDVYNCVDIYKQPAFDHPSLKDHKIQIPKDYWSRMKNLTSKPSKFGLKEGCPLGTVPIRRITKENLIKAKFDSKIYSEFHDRKEQGNGFEFAGFQTIKTPGRVYHGTGASIDLYNPAVQPKEFSSSMISIESGPPNERNYIQVGWTVNPSLYGDSNTRLFTSWTKDNHQTTGCVNTFCNGFVLLNAKIPLDAIFKKTSKVDGDQYDVRLGVYQHNITKVWNFVVGEDEILIGYWPPNIFSHLASGADYIQWGGQVYSPNPEEHSPQMGSGVWNDGWYDESCYFREVIYLDAAYTPQIPDNAYIKKANSRCYNADDNNYKDFFYQYSFVFGGPGGASYECLL